MAKQIQDDNKFSGVRLPTNVRPTHYELTLKPNFQDFTFSGQVKIEYTSTDKPDNIVLNANELVISDGNLQYNSTSRPLTTVTYSRATETATLEFQGGIEPSGTLCLNFTGLLNNKMKGFYRTEFKIDNTPVTAATTQFEATDARRCFPCWDEPAIKATFSVSLVMSEYIDVGEQKYEQVALSNMPEISRAGTPDEMVVKFEKTPIMSTYLLALIVGPFEMIESTDSRRPIRVFTTPGKKEQGRYALDVTVKALPYYESYFNVKYPLPKMDLVAVPDFAAGAMENWGLVTYRETCILVDPNNTSTAAKQDVALVVAHELAHQWFGNLVTMEWWTHLWLNEGFATFMEFLCVEHVCPEFNIWAQFVSSCYNAAMSLDSLHNSHPIEVPVKHTSEIDEIFDDISYNKGSSVIRMLYNYIGDDCFRAGMKDYLNKYAYKNALTEDLWDCLEAASNKPVRELMTGWTSQKGYPWLSVEHSQDGVNSKLHVTQSKFNVDGTIPDGDAESKWLVPIDYVTGNNQNQKSDAFLLKGKSGEIIIPNVGNSWIKLNSETIGLYRTSYPASLLDRLLLAISDQSLSPMDRLGMLGDYYALCQAGKFGTVDLLKMLKSFRNETQYPVWASLSSCLRGLDILMCNTDYRDRFHIFCRELLQAVFEKLGWVPIEGESHFDALTRPLIISQLVSYGHGDVVAEARNKFKSFVQNGSFIPADIRSSVYLAASKYGDDVEFEKLFDIYRTTETQEEKRRCAMALGSAKDSKRLQRVIEFIFSDDVRVQDKTLFLSPVGRSNPSLAWNVLRERKDYLRKQYESGPHIQRAVQFTTENFGSEDRAKEMEKFFEENKFPGAERTIQQSLEKTRLRAAWLNRDIEKIEAFLS